MSESYKLQASPEMMANATEGLELTKAEIRVMENVKDIHENLQRNKADNLLLSLRKRLDLLLRTGQLLLESAADTNRIRRNKMRA